MYDRNQISHLVFWPNGKGSSLALVSDQGEVLSQLDVKEPVKGSELAKFVPNGYSLDPGGCVVLSMAGQIIVGTKAPFDTSVVTERAEVTFEERMARLERIEVNNRRRQVLLEKRNQELMRQLQQHEAEPQVEVAQEVNPEAEAVQVGEQVAEGDPNA